MFTTTTKKQRDHGIRIEQLLSIISDIQVASGEIPWHIDGKTDPWDHVESAMGLTVGRQSERARRAYIWLKETQEPDGSWPAARENGIVTDSTRDANFVSYVAVGIYHYLLATGDTDFARHMWHTVKSAVDFSLGLQAPGGEIHWAIDPNGRIDPMALLTASSSVYMSVKCGMALADHLGEPMSQWRTPLRRLGQAISGKPQLFNMTKSRFSMDWYYPILCGAVTGFEAQQRIDKYWKKYVVKDLGVRCVSDQPWVTIAETCELVLTLSAMGKHSLSEIVLGWIFDQTFEDGSFWCGFTFPDMTVWPTEKIAWTNAAVLLAMDAVYHLTPAGQLFSHRYWYNRS
ncbi:MAG: phenyltransferase domain-containing protein [Desulfobacteraceae bacterium]|nr:phenyltransferase domain-containing protein [Desulfobacteraceae bacterium]